MLMGNSTANKSAGYEHGNESTSVKGNYLNIPDPKNAGRSKGGSINIRISKKAIDDNK